jgi:hypothetical protein
LSNTASGGAKSKLGRSIVQHQTALTGTVRLRIWILDGFNESWIDFQGASIKGSIEFESVIRKLVEQQSN